MVRVAHDQRCPCTMCTGAKQRPEPEDKKAAPAKAKPKKGRR